MSLPVNLEKEKILLPFVELPLVTYLDIRFCSELLSADIAAEWFPLAVSEHVLPHISCSSQLLVADAALVLSSSVMGLKHDVNAR